jgi:hypothetical protein
MIDVAENLLEFGVLEPIIEQALEDLVLPGFLVAERIALDRMVLEKCGDIHGRRLAGDDTLDGRPHSRRLL